MNPEAGIIILRAQHSKNRAPRILPLAGELAPLVERRWQARAIPQKDGSTRLAEFVFHEKGNPIGDFRKAWGSAVRATGMSGVLFHDLRRSAVRNMDRSGVGQAVAMKITGHKTLSVYQRYRIVSEGDLRDALERTHASLKPKQARKAVTAISRKKDSGGIPHSLHHVWAVTSGVRFASGCSY